MPSVSIHKRNATSQVAKSAAARPYPGLRLIQVIKKQPKAKNEDVLRMAPIRNMDHIFGGDYTSNCKYTQCHEDKKINERSQESPEDSCGHQLSRSRSLRCCLGAAPAATRNIPRLPTLCCRWSRASLDKDAWKCESAICTSACKPQHSIEQATEHSTHPVADGIDDRFCQFTPAQLLGEKIRRTFLFWQRTLLGNGLCHDRWHIALMGSCGRFIRMSQQNPFQTRSERRSERTGDLWRDRQEDDKYKRPKIRRISPPSALKLAFRPLQVPGLFAGLEKCDRILKSTSIQLRPCRIRRLAILPV